MMRYRKKPIVVEAFQLTDDPEMEAPAWFAQAVIDERIWIYRRLSDGHIKVYGCTVDTPEGRMKAHLGDYIIRGVNGELYPCKPGIFHKTYEPAGEVIR